MSTFYKTGYTPISPVDIRGPNVHFPITGFTVHWRILYVDNTIHQWTNHFSVQEGDISPQTRNIISDVMVVHFHGQHSQNIQSFTL